MNLDEPNADRLVIASTLRRLGWTIFTNGFEFERLAGGLSGSSVWRIDLDGQALVLKATPATSGRDLLERAEREVGFYRDLAGRVPVRVPHCVGTSVGEDGVVLLLGAESPAPPLEDWTEREFQRVSHDLGRLHGTFWGETGIETLSSWLRQPSPVRAEQSIVAEAHWRDLVVPSGSDYLRKRMVRLVAQVPALNRTFAILPLTLCHGDAHRDNLLQAETGEWIWADWQGVRLGQGVDDLAFFWQRAFTATEAIPAPDRLLDIYWEGLLDTGVTSVSLEVLSQALLWSELRMWAIDWPPYLGWLASNVLERVLRRCEELSNQLGVDDAMA